MIDLVLRYTLPAALSLLPSHLRVPNAVAMLLAIGLQESGFVDRKQLGGPARGFWQFEVAGVEGVLEHPATGPMIQEALRQLQYPPVSGIVGAVACQSALEHNDILAACFARLFLYTIPAILPGRDDPDEAWQQYLETWRPGRPRRLTWDGYYSKAWALVAPTTQEG